MASSSSSAAADDAVARAIARDASDFVRELEVDRVIRAFKLK